jgi:hypothetical protein
MKVTPRSEEEIKKDMAPAVLPEGEYSFEILSAKEEVSSKGSPMIVPYIKVYGTGGVTTQLNDYLMTNSPQMEFKFRHACLAVSPSLQESYEAGEVHAEQFVGKTGKLYLKIKKGGKEYAKRDGTKGISVDQNVVADYIVGGKAEVVDDPTVPF